MTRYAAPAARDRVTTRLDVTPRWVVELRPAAIRDLAGEAVRSASGREIGGWLFGTTDGPGRITIRRACATSPTAAVRDPGYVTRRIAHGHRQSRLRAVPIVGGWHTHIDPVTALSDSDRRTCSAELEILRDDYGDDALAFVEIIATRNPHGGWTRPDLTAYVFTDTAGTVEQAEIRR